MPHYREHSVGVYTSRQAQHPAHRAYTSSHGRHQSHSWPAQLATECTPHHPLDLPLLPNRYASPSLPPSLFLFSHTTCKLTIDRNLPSAPPTASLLVYLLGMLFTSNFVMIFIITIILLAMDFYYLKNIAGRRLVGLRWWNEVNGQSGDSHWVFESAPQANEPGGKIVNATDKRFFWLALYAQPALWVALAVVALVKFMFVWLTLVGECLLGGDGEGEEEEEEEEEKDVVRGTKTRGKLTCGQLLRWFLRLRILWHSRDVTSLVRQADLWKEASSRVHWRGMWEAQCFRDCSIGDRKKKEKQIRPFTYYSWQRRKTITDSLCPARPSGNHLLPHSLAYLLHSSSSHHIAVGGVMISISHALTHARMLKGYPFQTFQRTPQIDKHSPGAFPTPPSPSPAKKYLSTT